MTPTRRYRTSAVGVIRGSSGYLLGEKSFELAESRLLITRSGWNRSGARTRLDEFDEVVVHALQRRDTAEPIDEQLGGLMRCCARRSRPRGEPPAHLLLARHQRNLDERRSHGARQPFKLRHELGPGDELRDDHIVTCLQGHLGHPDGHFPSELPSVCGLIGPAAEQAAHDVDVEVQRQWVRRDEPRRNC
jgi:hypothetical protein